ncbi:hypothetical protein L1D55_14405 [Vibrio sp. Isolate22]|uniref:hypothetical protein n=1 Tax=Vibrio sp. Isolate22 TaxID=2908532 RepID=UPI001EFD2252|nr:hypothetical protein [Vibrio sp. Isolate22]MCG9692917.1 hypothetical protein [Vibrio sp. Isolate22]
MKPKYSESLINQMRQIQRDKKKKNSKLESFKKEILILRHVNLSYKKISIWLDNKHNTKASLSQIHYMTSVAWKDDPFLKDIKSMAKYE